MKKAAALLLLAACASGPNWQKEGAAKESIEADLYACQTQAPVQPRVQGPRGMPSGLGGQQRGAFDAMAEREGERMQKDEKFVAECMRKKGYSG
jgi:hypothetical protein